MTSHNAVTERFRQIIGYDVSCDYNPTTEEYTVSGRPDDIDMIHGHLTSLYDYFAKQIHNVSHTDGVQKSIRVSNKIANNLLDLISLNSDELGTDLLTQLRHEKTIKAAKHSFENEPQTLKVIGRNIADLERTVTGTWKYDHDDGLYKCADPVSSRKNLRHLRNSAVGDYFKNKDDSVTPLNLGMVFDVLRVAKIMFPCSVVNKDQVALGDKLGSIPTHATKREK